MEIFLDTANLDEIKLYKDFIDGVTTNPSIMAGSDAKDINSRIKEICKIVSGPVSVEVTSENYDDMLAEAKRISQVHNDVCVKLPCTFDGLRICGQLADDGIAVNMTLCFSPAQAILAAKCGAVYVSPFIGRLDDIGQDGMNLIEEIVNIYEAQNYETVVLAASVRNMQHVIQTALLGVGAITVPPAIFKQFFEHPLTTKGLEIFARDWKKAQHK